MKNSTFKDSDNTAGDNTVPKLIDLNEAAKNLIGRFLLHLLNSPLENALSLNALNRVYAKYYEKTLHCNDPKKIFHLGLDALNVTYSVSEADLQKNTCKGPPCCGRKSPFWCA